jgi:mannosyltransferase
VAAIDRRVAIGVSALVSATVVLPTLGRQPLSWNEAVSLSAAQRSLPNLVGMLRHTDAPLGLYYLLLRGWVSLLALVGVVPTAFWLRLPSALAVIMAVALAAALAARWFGSRAALLAGVLLAVHPLLTFYGQDARPYGLVTLAFLASTWLLMRGLQTPTASRLAVYALVSTVTVYLHLFAGYAFAAHVLLVLHQTRGDRGRRLRWLATGAAVVAACLPLVILARGQSQEVGWIPKPSVASVSSTVANVFGGAALLLVFVVIMVVASRSGADGEMSSMIKFLSVWALVPVAALVVVDLVVPDLVARYALVSVPAAVIVVAAIATRARSRSVTGLVALAVAVSVVTVGVQQSRSFKYEDYRTAADLMGDSAQPGDAVMFLPISTRVGFEPYRKLEPDMAEITDPALLPGRPPALSQTIGGVDRSSSALAAAFARAPVIFVLGDSLATARRTLRDPTDVSQLDALRAYRVTRSLRYGDLYLTVLQLGTS